MAVAMTSSLSNGAICSLPLNATSLTCFLAEVNVKHRRNRAGSFNSDMSTAPSVIVAKNASDGVAEDMPEEWTKSRVLALGAELLEGFHVPKFQKQLKDLLANSRNCMQVPGRMVLALTVQCEVLPKYGFPGTAEGVEAMLDVVSPFLVDKAVKDMISDIDQALGLPTNTTAKVLLGSLAKENAKEVPKQTAKAGKLTHDQVLSLGGELLDAFRQPAFQEVLQAIIKGNTHHNVALERSELAMSVQSKILPKYGLPGDFEGVGLMLEAFSPYASHWMVASIVNAVDESLGLSAGTTLSSLVSIHA